MYERRAHEERQMNEALRRIAGALAGTAVGVLVYRFMLERDVHVLAAVGAGTALGVSLLARGTRRAWGVVTAILAVVASLGVEWTFRPFVQDPSLGFFVAHVADLPRNSQLSLAVVAGLGWWLGRGRRRRIAAPQA
jgi:hypothetical protein